MTHNNPRQGSKLLSVVVVIFNKHLAWAFGRGGSGGGSHLKGTGMLSKFSMKPLKVMLSVGCKIVHHRVSIIIW